MVTEAMDRTSDASFSVVGGALFRRAAHLLVDEAAAAHVAEQLFVRFVVYGRAETLDTRARWAWIYRVATNHCLRQLPDDARPGRLASEQNPFGVSVPTMGELRRLDEATRLIVVLAALDRLTPDEIAEVVGLPGKLVRRRIATQTQPADAPAAEGGAPHPSLLALDRDRSALGEHLVGCVRCRRIAADADRLADRFAGEMAPVATARVIAAVKTENARLASGPGWKRGLWMGGGLLFAASLALLVARPRAVDRRDVPYAGLKGASRATAAGIQITVGRGLELTALAPGAILRPGDRLHFRVRLERPRYLELRVHDSAGDARVFPHGGTSAQLVNPGQTLDRDYVVRGGDPPGVGSPGSGGQQKLPVDRLWIVGLFADQTFLLDQDPKADTEVVPVRVDVGP
jgi:DNA-directed RNA polymerase specialized sigma24 family protein